MDSFLGGKARVPVTVAAAPAHAPRGREAKGESGTADPGAPCRPALAAVGARAAERSCSF
eukprot:69729-Alexandrium_andersonii.AAC.1